MDEPTILIVGTLDTKAPELSYLHSQIKNDGRCRVKVLDVGWKESYQGHDSIPKDIISRPSALKNIQADSRGDLIAKTIEAVVPVVEDLVKDAQIQGIVSAGGSCGTSVATAIMRRSCPVGFPKLMVSTVASGDVKYYVEDTDVTMMYSVVDIAGLNSVLKQVLGNAAGAIVGMTRAYAARIRTKAASESGDGKKRIAITMFGVTTPCVDKIRQLLGESEQYGVPMVFHATGAGGQAMERLVREGQIDALIDLTTTEIADALFGGVFSAGLQRLEAAAKKGIPQVLSVGATDMINFGPMDTVPAKHRNRNLVQHNPAVTLLRTNFDECRQIGEFIARKLKSSATSTERVKVLLPVGGVSMLDRPGQPFFDADADEALFKAIDKGLDGTGIEVQRVDHNVNDDAFASLLVEQLKIVMSN